MAPLGDLSTLLFVGLDGAKQEPAGSIEDCAEHSSRCERRHIKKFGGILIEVRTWSIAVVPKDGKIGERDLCCESLIDRKKIGQRGPDGDLHN